MSDLTSSAYPPALSELLARLPLAPLGSGRPDAAMRERLAALTDAEVFGRVADRDMASCCRAALWLAFDFLDESHEISQGVHTVEGSYWHAIMHRREPDHSNAAYWLRRVGTHPVHADLARAANDLGYETKGPAWNAFAFNDACERHRGRGDATEELLRKVQQAEWQLLFAYCFRRATAGAERTG